MFKEFVTGIRPKTLAAAFMPPILAAGYMRYLNLEIDYYILFHCLGLALFIQIATNFYNDGIDFKKGADVDRDGPKRITNSENMKRVFLFGHVSLFLAFMFGIPLIIKGGAFFAILGLTSLFLAYGYTGGPFPLAYLGLGELFVFLFFGLVSTLGSAYLMGALLDTHWFLVACIPGLLSTVLIMINNFRDRDKDVLVGKRTLATRVSKERYKTLIDLCLFSPYLIIFYFFCFIDLKFIFPILSAGLAHRIRQDLIDAKVMGSLNNTLGMAGKHLVMFTSLFILSCVV